MKQYSIIGHLMMRTAVYPGVFGKGPERCIVIESSER